MADLRHRMQVSPNKSFAIVSFRGRLSSCAAALHCVLISAAHNQSAAAPPAVTVATQLVVDSERPLRAIETGPDDRMNRTKKWEMEVVRSCEEQRRERMQMRWEEERIGKEELYSVERSLDGCGPLEGVGRNDSREREWRDSPFQAGDGMGGDGDGMGGDASPLVDSRWCWRRRRRSGLSSFDSPSLSPSPPRQATRQGIIAPSSFTDSHRPSTTHSRGIEQAVVLESRSCLSRLRETQSEAKDAALVQGSRAQSRGTEKGDRNQRSLDGDCSSVSESLSHVHATPACLQASLSHISVSSSGPVAAGECPSDKCTTAALSPLQSMHSPSLSPLPPVRPLSFSTEEQESRPMSPSQEFEEAKRSAAALVAAKAMLAATKGPTQLKKNESVRSEPLQQSMRSAARGVLAAEDVSVIKEVDGAVVSSNVANRAIGHDRSSHGFGDRAERTASPESCAKSRHKRRKGASAASSGSDDLSMKDKKGNVDLKEAKDKGKSSRAILTFGSDLKNSSISSTSSLQTPASLQTSLQQCDRLNSDGNCQRNAASALELAAVGEELSSEATTKPQSSASFLSGEIANQADSVSSARVDEITETAVIAVAEQKTSESLAGNDGGKQGGSAQGEPPLTVDANACNSSNSNTTCKSNDSNIIYPSAAVPLDDSDTSHSSRSKAVPSDLLENPTATSLKMTDLRENAELIENATATAKLGTAGLEAETNASTATNKLTPAGRNNSKHRPRERTAKSTINMKDERLTQRLECKGTELKDQTIINTSAPVEAQEELRRIEIGKSGFGDESCGPSMLDGDGNSKPEELGKRKQPPTAFTLMQSDSGKCWQEEQRLNGDQKALSNADDKVHSTDRPTLPNVDGLGLHMCQEAPADRVNESSRTRKERGNAMVKVRKDEVGAVSLMTKGAASNHRKDQAPKETVTLLHNGGNEICEGTGSAGPFFAQDGRQYWFDAATNSSTWDKPSDLMSDREKR